MKHHTTVYEINGEKLDELILEYCKEHGINLIIIPYWDEARVNYDYILQAAGY